MKRISNSFFSRRWVGLLSAVTCAALASLAFDGCAKRAASEGKGGGKARALRIGMSFQELDNPYFAVMKQAFDEAGTSIGAEMFVTDARHDLTKQISDIEDLVQRKVDILLLNPTDSVGVEGAVREAKKAGVVVIAVDAQANGPVDAFVGSKNYDAGFLAGEQLSKVLEGKGEVAILDGIPVVPILERVRGFKAAIAKSPGIKLVDTQNGRQERSVALTVTENMIQSHPDLKGLFSVNDGGALGALSAIEASGKNIALVSVDGLAEVVGAVQKGQVFKATVAQFPRDQVRIALGIGLAKYWGASVPKEIPIDVKLLTAENAKGFAW
ncbi:MAG TPA: ABC transporter substrate-binding protein [Opitutaceae bacterium]|nr:ABC transporter substrate-binding protein [Opitutaceae bacterium]